MTPLIYLVDDEPVLLDMLAEYLAKACSDWRVERFTSPTQALEATAKSQPNIVISDFSMPEMTGTVFLEHIREKAPHTVRFLVSGYANPKQMGNKLSAAHQYLAKPYTLADIRSKIVKALAALGRFKNPEICGTVLSIRTLPAMPSIYYELIRALEDPESSYNEVVDILAKDAVISAKILQMANSPLFRENSVAQIIDLLQAITVLGTERIKAAVLSHQVFGNYTQVPEYFHPGSLQQHRWDTANGAFQIAQRMDLTEDQIRDAYVAGLMHDMGRLVLLDNFAATYRATCQRALAEKRPLTSVEEETFKMSQADVVGFLVSLWGMRDRISNAIIYQEKPWEAPTPDAVKTATAVYLSHMKAHKGRRSEKFQQPEPNMEFLESQDVAQMIK
jgi:HD-like signal output (HDOD) protein